MDHLGVGFQRCWWQISPTNAKKMRVLWYSKTSQQYSETMTDKSTMYCWFLYPIVIHWKCWRGGVILYYESTKSSLDFLNSTAICEICHQRLSMLLLSNARKTGWPNAYLCKLSQVWKKGGTGNFYHLRDYSDESLKAEVVLLDSLCLRVVGLLITFPLHCYSGFVHA